MRATRRTLILSWLLVSACNYDAISVTQPIGGGDAGTKKQPKPPGEDASTTEPDDDAGLEDTPDAAGDASTTEADAAAPTGVAVAVIEPMYPWAPQLGQYVQSKDPTQPCLPDASGRAHDTCFDAGVWRVIQLPNETSCDGLTVNSSTYTSWRCSVEGDHVRLETDLDVSLFSWVNLGKGTWRKEQVTVKRDGEPVARTEPQAPWTNSLHVLRAPASSDPIELDEPLAVYALDDEAVGSHLVITADGVTLLGGSQWKPIASLRTEGRRAFLRIVDMYVDPGGSAGPVNLDVVHSFVENVSTTRSVSVPGLGPDIAITCDASRVAYVSATDPLDVGIQLSADACDVEALHVERAPADCLDVSAVDTLVNVAVLEQCGGTGLYASGVVRSTLRNVSVARAAGDCVQALGAQDSLLQEVEAFDCGGSGIVVDGTLLGDESRNTTLLDVETTNNGFHGLYARGLNLRVVKVLAASNEVDGVYLYGDRALLMHATAAQNGSRGVRVGSGAGSTLVNIVSVNNGVGLILEEPTLAARVRGLFATDNDIDVSIWGDDHTFEGDVWLTSPTSCEVASTATNPGLLDTPACGNDPDNQAVLHIPSSTVGAFAGRLPFGDEYNATWLDADGSVAYENILLDTFQFEMRHYGTDAGTFPNATARGRCGPGERCAVWDWQVTKTGGLFNRVGAAPAAYASDPAREVLHVWSVANESECDAIPAAVWEVNQCRSHFLDCAYAQHVAYLNLGHFTVPPVDNGLCDAGETCWLHPNLGAYAGTGSAVAVTKSAWLGTTLEKFRDNGR